MEKQFIPEQNVGSGHLLISRLNFNVYISIRY
jgi:hypothetical protein